jgi:hypothetical protein
MTGKVSPTLRVLMEMRDELRRLRVETNERFETLETRLATELTAVAGAVTDVRTLLADRLDLRDRVEDHESRLRKLERRTS